MEKMQINITIKWNDDDDNDGEKKSWMVWVSLLRETSVRSPKEKIKWKFISHYHTVI